MRYQVIGLTDGFGLPDFVLKAPIAKYDGNIYQGKKRDMFTPDLPCIEALTLFLYSLF